MRTYQLLALAVALTACNSDVPTATEGTELSTVKYQQPPAKKSPVKVIILPDGKYTLDGEWLIDAKGRKVKITKEIRLGLECHAEMMEVYEQRQRGGRGRSEAQRNASPCEELRELTKTPRPKMPMSSLEVSRDGTGYEMLAFSRGDYTCWEGAEAMIQTTELYRTAQTAANVAIGAFLTGMFKPMLNELPPVAPAMWQQASVVTAVMHVEMLETSLNIQASVYLAHDCA